MEKIESILRFREMQLVHRSTCAENRWVKTGAAGGDSIATLVPRVVAIVDVLDEHCWEGATDFSYIYAQVFGRPLSTNGDDNGRILVAFPNSKLNQR